MKALFADDAYLSTCEATVTGIRDDGGIELDQTCFYATSGGQPGDTGFFERADGTRIQIAGTINGATKADIVHLPAPDQPAPAVGETVTLHIDWDRRYKLMRLHTACHLLSVVCPYPITGASISEEDARVDFDMSETIDKAEVTEKLMALVEANHPVYIKWISEEEFEANPDIVKSKNVRPPRGLGRMRLVCIGDEATVDSQPCGGTHVKNTSEIGSVKVSKIENKGRRNRRVHLVLEP